MNLYALIARAADLVKRTADAVRDALRRLWPAKAAPLGDPVEGHFADVNDIFGEDCGDTCTCQVCIADDLAVIKACWALPDYTRPNAKETP